MDRSRFSTTLGRSFKTILFCSTAFPSVGGHVHITAKINKLTSSYLGDQFSVVPNQELFQAEDERRGIAEMEDPRRCPPSYSELDSLRHQYVGDHVH